MATEFSLWLTTLSPLAQLVTIIGMMTITFFCLWLDYRIEEEKSFRKFVYEYYNGTLCYRGGHF